MTGGVTWGRRAALVGALLAGCEGGCEDRPAPEARGAAPESFAISRPAPARPAPASFAVAERDGGTSAVPPRGSRGGLGAESEITPGLAAEATEVGGSVSGPFVIDSLVDVGPAGPIGATARGVAMFDRADRLQLAPLRLPLSKSGAPRDTPLTPLPDEAGPFTLARGPAVSRGLAYWVSRGRLLGQSLASAGAGSPIVLREDARVGTRAAVPAGAADALARLPQVAAYIARPSEPSGPAVAKLWVEGQPSALGLTDDLASAHSVSLVADERGLSVVFLEARTGMSSVHARRVSFGPERQPRLEQDQVAWVAGPAQPTTEIFALPGEPGRLQVFLALERDITHFGLVGLDISLGPAEAEPAADWLLYENGIQPAPFAVAELCGLSALVLARPSSAMPHAPQELVLLSPIGEDGARAALIARSRAFFDVSLAAVPGGALLAYVADHRTWARTIRCARR